MDSLRSVFEKRALRRVKLGGFDLDGVLRGKYVSMDKFWSAMDKGLGFCDVVFGWDMLDALYDNATLTGWHTGYPDILARIDSSTLRVWPHEPETAQFLVDFYGNPGPSDRAGEGPDTGGAVHLPPPHPACPRNLLKQVVARLAAAGFVAKVGLEFEFWLFKETSASASQKGYRGLTTLSPGMFGYSWVRQGQHAALLEDMLDTLRDYGIELEGLHTETGPGVYEVALKAADPLAAADAGALFKTALKILSAKHDCMVTFMAKWNSELPGSSGHIHQSLWDQSGEQNLFSDPGAPDGLSKLAKHYLGGLVTLAPELTALYSPTVNSYKRYVPGMWAPTTATWGIENRMCALRAITGPGTRATRVEQRQTAADINPYVAVATCLAAGLHGVQNALEPPPAAQGDATALATAAPLPKSLAAANQVLAQSQLACELLGEAFIDHYVRTRDWELRAFERRVTDWELKRYFEVI